MLRAAEKGTVRVLGCLVVTAAVLVAGTATALVPVHSADAAAGRPGRLDKQVSAVAASFQVPRALLLAVGYVNTRWEVPARASRGGGWGPMRLTRTEPRDTLGLAARLTGETVRALKHERLANLRGGAAVLAHVAGTPRPSELAGWYPVLADLGGQLYAEQVFRTLRRGGSATLASGERVTIASRDVTVSQRAPQRAPQRPRWAQANETDYPEATSHPAHPNNYTDANRPFSEPITKIVVHVTQETYSDTIDIFQDPNSNVSAHYIVRSSDGAVAQSVREEDIAYHAGNYSYNRNSIGIEHEGFVDDPSWFTDEMYRSSAKLAAYLVRKYQIPIDRNHIVGHSEVPGATHTDPGQHWDWDKYLSLVREYVTGHIETFSKGSDGELRTHRYDPQAGWQAASLGGSAASTPTAVVSVDDGSRHAFARGRDDRLVHWWYDQGWRNETIAGSIVSPPAAAISPITGELHVFARSAGSELSHWVETGDGWFYEELPGPVTSAPAVDSSPLSSTLHVFARGGSEQLGHWFYTSNGWLHEQLSGPVRSAPTVEASPLSHTLHVFAEGSNGQLGHWLYTGDSWFHEQLSGPVTARPNVAVSPVTGTLHVFGKGSDRQLGHWYYIQNQGWSHEQIGGSAISGPAATVSPISETLHVFARSADNQLSHWLWTGSDWYQERLSGPTTSAPSAITRYD